jgi:uncharacterized protein YbaR (Trm112 family)
VLERFPVLAVQLTAHPSPLRCITSAMPIDPKLLEILACPKCRGPLESKADGSALLCRACRLAYSIVDEIPNLIVEDAQPLAE